MAYQIGIPYVLTGPDGTRVVFNDRTDPDFIGFLDPDTGITGLDSPEVRENADTLVEADGGINGNNYYGRRPIILNGMIDPNADIQTVNTRGDRLMAAADAMKGDAILTWTETGRVQTMLRLRRQQPPRLSGRLPKVFQVPLVSEYDRIVSASEQSVVIVPGAAISAGGFSSLLTSPLTSSYSVVGQQVITNQGRKSAHWRARIDGPCVNPVIQNASTGQQIKIIYTLNTGEWLDLETRPGKRYLKLNGTASRWGAIDFANSTFFELNANGTTQINFQPFSYSAGAQLTVYWRHTWIS